MLEQRRKVAWAVAGSLGLHALLLLLWAVVVGFVPKPAQKTPKEEKPLRVTLTPLAPKPTPTPTPAAVGKPPILFADTAGMVERDSPPPDTRFTSARNTVDASEAPSPDAAHRPGQQGTPSPVFAMRTQEIPAAPALPPDAPPPPPQTAPPLPRAVAKASTPPPEVLATPAPVRGGTLALATPASLPAEPAVESNPFDPAFRPPANLTEPLHPTPVASRDYYQPNKLKTALSGSISNRGATSVASVATPIGRYQSAVIAAIDQRWRAYTDSRIDLLRAGTVTIRFLVGMDGKPRGVQVLSNTSNEALASVSLRSISDAKIPPMPRDAVPQTDGGQLPIDLPFEILEANN